MQTTASVSWNTYAQTYDMLIAYNPFYQQLHEDVMNQLRKWNIKTGDLIADIGAGTGNYSLAIARRFPTAHVLHIDRDEGMNAVTADKKNKELLYNHHILSKNIEDVKLEEGSLQALVSVHALYAFPNPKDVLRKMYKWLESGGRAVLVDAGRIVNVLDWQLAVGSRLIRQHGLRKTLEILREGREVSKQNAYIRNMQRNGTFWTHSHEEFCEAVKEAGFEIEHSQTCFRGVSDLVTVRKS